jgi:hypothetical protein
MYFEKWSSVINLDLFWKQVFSYRKKLKFNLIYLPTQNGTSYKVQLDEQDITLGREA